MIRSWRSAERRLWRWSLRGAQIALAVTALAAVVSQPGLAANGLFLGSILALGAIGITLIYGIHKFANIAQGDFMTFGAYVGFFLLTDIFPQRAGLGPFTFGYPLLLALPVSMAVGAGVAMALDRGVYRRLRARGASLGTMAIASLGVAYWFLEGG